MPRIVVFTDLDGSLLDSVTYSFEAAREALDELRLRGIPLILSSSKTRAEIERLRTSLNDLHPFIVENGGGLVVPKGYFPFPLEQAVLRGPYQVIELGTSYGTLRIALKEIMRVLGCHLRGFGDMPTEEIAERTGLNLAEALLAKQREYDEPFLIEPPSPPLEAICREAETHGLSCTKGERFYHLMGASDKGRACRYLTRCYRQRDGEVITVAIGDSLNDLPMLAAVDKPIQLPHADGSYDAGIALTNLIRAKGHGPAGWNHAVLDLLRSTPVG